MNIFQSSSELQSHISPVLEYQQNSLHIKNQAKLTDIIDDLVFTATFTDDSKTQQYAREIIYRLALQLGIYPSSINNLYFAIGRGEISGFTVPAMNVRMMTYDTAQVIFELCKKNNIGTVIFEIARSEMQYTYQKPAEYTTSVLAGAIKSGYHGPVFVQGDHFQFSPAKFKENPDTETQKLKDLVKESIAAGFYNIDIDPSTLVDLAKTTLDEQQKINYTKTSEMTRYIRSLEPTDLPISIGGEIGHIGGVNSTIGDFEAFMNGYLKEIGDMKGISKVSVQTGTSHGGIPMPDGTIAEVKIDFNVLRDIGESARNKYHIGGPVQHGASTLPDSLFNKFPQSKAIEIHLATGFQNIIYDTMPQELKEKMYDWIRENTRDEWKTDQTEDQNIYKTRKKAIGPFKKHLWSLSPIEKKPIKEKLSQKFEFLFKQLNVLNTKDIADKYAVYSKQPAAQFTSTNSTEEKVDDLSD